MDLPNISGVYASTGWSGARCSGAGRPPTINQNGELYQPEDYWQGISANMPGGGEMLQVAASTPKPTTGGPYYWTTSGFTVFSCLSGIKNGQSGEGFLAVTADGTRYWFDWLATFYETPLKGASGNSTLTRNRMVLFATRVEDRFGNWVTYTFDPSVPKRLTRIDANDGRFITVAYNAAGYVSAVSNGVQTWNYVYGTPTASTATLTTVILPTTPESPDNGRWTIDFAGLSNAVVRYAQGAPGEPVRSCGEPGDVTSLGAVGTITHPSGAVGEFAIDPLRHGRSNVPKVCGNYTSPYNDDNDDVAVYPLQFDALSLTRKRVSGPGIATAEWNYTYNSDIYWAAGTGPICTSGSCIEPLCLADACAGSDVTVVAGPEGQWIRYRFGNSYRYNEGKLLTVERGTGPTDVRKVETTTYEWAQGGQSYATPIGTSPQLRGVGFKAEYLRPQRSSVINQDGATFSSTVAAGASGFDAFARPKSVTKSSSLGCTPCTRTDATAYSDNLSAWVLGQVASVTNADTGKVVSQTTYDATTALPLSTYSFGNPQPVQRLTYYADGTVATVKDGNDNTTTLSNWKRGIPQLIQYPATPDSPSGSTESADVNDIGWVRSITDETAATKSFTYDAMGRLSSVSYPAGDTTAWNATTRSFVPVVASEFGLPAGHWRMSVQTGTGVTTTYYDAFWRPVLTWSRDTASAGTDSFVVNRYDSLGRQTFVSYPVNNLTTIADALTGTSTTYDALDRVYQVKQDSELGAPLTTTTTYLTGFQVRVTNPRNYATTTSFQAFDTPSTDSPVSIASPGGISTTIVRDVFGKPKSTTRSGPGG